VGVRASRDRLAEAGATEVIQPELEAASTFIRHALRRLALPRDETLEYLMRFREAMDAGMPAGASPTEAMARKVVTQVTVLKKVAIVIIGIFTLASMLMVFDSVRQFGTSILASAGIAGLIIGFAAQRSIATLLAGSRSHSPSPSESTTS
jgi:small-conductance mechanosensitive channel